MTLKTSTILAIIATALAMLAEASSLLFGYFFSFGIGVLIRLLWLSSIILFFSVLLKNQNTAEKSRHDNTR